MLGAPCLGDAPKALGSNPAHPLMVVPGVLIPLQVVMAETITLRRLTGHLHTLARLVKGVQHGCHAVG